MFNFRSWLDPIHINKENLKEVRKEVSEISSPVRSYFVLLVLSTAIATYGLLSGSTAVVIGAMLVAPLMGPIFGIALSIVSGARRMLFRATTSEVLGAFLVVFMAYLLMKFGPDVSLTQEVLSRTRPTILDIAIALASGFAGAFAMVNGRVNAALPGVAISTALVPPLAACGVCLGAGELALAGGAFLLFFANFVAIELAAALTFTIYGLRREKAGSGFKGFFSQFGWPALLLVVMSVFFYRTLAQTIYENSLHSQVGSILSEMSSDIPGARLDQYSVTPSQDGLEVAAVFLTPTTINPNSVASIEKKLEDEVDEKVHLIVRSLQSSDADGNGPVYVSQAKIDAEQQAQTQAAYYDGIQNAAKSYLSRLSGASLERLSIPFDSQQLEVTAVVNTPTAVSPAQVSELQKAMRDLTGRPLNLTVRSLITIDVNSEKYIYAPADPPAPTQRQLLITDRMTSILKRRLKVLVDGADLVSLTVTKNAGRWKVRAICRTPAPITPAMVRDIESDIHEFVSTDIDLVVQSVLASDATSQGYLGSRENSD